MTGMAGGILVLAVISTFGGEWAGRLADETEPVQKGLCHHFKVARLRKILGENLGWTPPSIRGEWASPSAARHGTSVRYE